MSDMMDLDDLDAPVMDPARTSEFAPSYSKTKPAPIPAQELVPSPSQPQEPASTSASTNKELLDSKPPPPVPSSTSKRGGPADELPPGWIKEIRTRTCGGRVKNDPSFIDPSGSYIFRSKKDVLRYLESGDIKNCLCQPRRVAAKKDTQKKAKRMKSVQELSTQCQRKADECCQAWMSLSAASAQLETLQMDLNSLDQNLAKQSEKLNDITSRYEHDKKTWIVEINDLSQKIKVLKQDQSQMSLEAHRCAESVPELNKMVSAVQALVAQFEDLKVKYSEEQAKRRKLHNQVQEAKGNIRVFCRCRPLNKTEVSIGRSTIVNFDSAKDGELGVNKKTFKFERVFSPKDNQANVFADVAPMVTSVLDGNDVCIFAYGQTGTGKTFTMEGTEEDRGVNYRTLEELFKIAKERSETFTYSISVNVLEVYNEQIRDLLATPSSVSKKLEVKQAPEGFHHIPGIVEAKVENTKEVWNVLQAGSSARAVGSNNVNEHSSRSHCMLCIMVKAKNLMNGECTNSKLWLVDLAGSERLANTDAQGDRLKEAQHINKSLSALGDVISALANKSSHIPYRNSKLTYLLQNSLGGDSKTLMFVQISPSVQDLSETLSSLNFAARVRGIELGPARKQVDTGKIQNIKTKLDKARQGYKSKNESIRKLQEKIKELEYQLVLKIVSHNQSEKQISNLSERLKGKEELSTGLQQKVEELEKKLKEEQERNSDSILLRQKELENKGWKSDPSA